MRFTKTVLAKVYLNLDPKSHVKMLDIDGMQEVRTHPEVVKESGIEYGKRKLDDTLLPTTAREDTSPMQHQCLEF